jgi:hypothetical protein
LPAGTSLNSRSDRSSGGCGHERSSLGQGYRDRLLAAFHFAPSAPFAAFGFSTLVTVHLAPDFFTGGFRVFSFAFSG